MAQTRPPIIGLTCSDLFKEDSPPRVGQNQSYVQALVRADAAPLIIPHPTSRAALRAHYELLDGLLLPGGVDIHPNRYGEPVHENCGTISTDRDEAELTLTRWAMEDGKPLLAICRGIQVLNVALGGSLYQDISSQVPGADKHDWYPGYARDQRPHTVAVTAGSRLAALTGATELPVNSLHHQALKDVAPGLVVTARAPDGIIEAVEAPDHPFALAVQWHPEELAVEDPVSQSYFDALVAAC